MLHLKVRGFYFSCLLFCCFVILFGVFLGLGFCLFLDVQFLLIVCNRDFFLILAWGVLCKSILPLLGCMEGVGTGK